MESLLKAAVLPGSAALWRLPPGGGARIHRFSGCERLYRGAGTGERRAAAALSEGGHLPAAAACTHRRIPLSADPVPRSLEPGSHRRPESRAAFKWRRQIAEPRDSVTGRRERQPEPPPGASPPQ
ncbi:uncharacterized protein V6R79_000512 [Siganus canaliculatus]